MTGPLLGTSLSLSFSFGKSQDNDDGWGAWVQCWKIDHADFDHDAGVEVKDDGFEDDKA